MDPFLQIKIKYNLSFTDTEYVELLYFFFYYVMHMQNTCFDN